MKKMMVAAKLVNLKNYQAMLDKFTRRISASPKKELTAGAA